MLFLRQIFGPGEFTPHGYCYLWNPGLVWLHVISDSLIAISYFTIPFALLWFVRKGRDIPFGFIFVLFGTFIIACGSTHVMEVWNLWHSEYWLAGGLKAITAIASVATAVAVTRLLPQAIGLRSVAEWSAANAALEQEVRARRELEASLLSTVATAREQSELLELIHDAIFVRNLQNEIVFWNRGAERLYGWSKDEVVGQTTHDLLQTVFPCDLELIKAAVLKEGHWEGELKHTTRGGRTVAVSSRWALRVGENGEPVGVLESNRDLTKLKYEEQKFRVLVEGIKDYSIVGLDLDGVVSTWNPGAERIKGYRAAEIIGKHFSCFYSQADAAIGKPAEMLRLAVQYGVVDEEGWRVRKDGSQFWADVIIRALYDDANNLIGFAKITRDGTGRRNLEQELRNANEFLEHRVSDRTLELATANAQLLNRQQEISALNESLEGRVTERTAELVRTNGELESFSYSVSHDLRAPLRHVDGFARILKEDFSSEIPPEGQRYLDRILHSATHMGQLIDDLLNLARIGRKDLKRVLVKMDDLIRQSLADLRLEEDRPIEWRIEAVPATDCDPGLLRLVFTNLLSNAAKFTRKCSPAVIEVGSCRKDGTLTLFVKDNGVGFDPQYADKLFGVFQRLHRQEDFEGTGIGLATVQRIIHRHGGKIWAESSLNGGAAFFFTLCAPAPLGSPASNGDQSCLIRTK